MRIEAGEDRMKDARRKEATWELLRTSISLMKENEGVWRSRKIAECDRIKEEEIGSGKDQEKDVWSAEDVQGGEHEA